MENYEKWLWLDLIGFDNRQPDSGVTDFLANAGFIPEAVSLLIEDPDFIHSFKAGVGNRVFPETYCSYGAHPRNLERERQRWTKLQLQVLVRALRKKSIKVFLSVFGGATWGDDALAYLKLKRHSVWADQHPELLNIQNSGARYHTLCVYKRLADGRYYEDFFLQQLVAVIDEYGFDGFHGADGFAPPSLAIYTADFSDDMFAQFVASEKLAVPAGVKLKCGARPELISRRADWIWSSKRKEWIEFYAKRSGRFWEKIIGTLHGMGKEVVLNSTWTRDPFESKYRFGMDYKILADAGVDAFVIEAPAGALELMHEKTPRALYDFMATLMLIKACVPKTRLIQMNAMNDTNEQYSTLRHGPMLFETDVFSLPNVFCYDSEARPRRCLAGILACLAAGITPDEWAWIRKRWDLGFATDPEQVFGATLIVSGNLFAGEVDDYLKTRTWSVHTILHHLITRGAHVYAIADVANLGRVKGPILILQSHLLRQSELEQALTYQGGPIILAGSGPLSTRLIPQAVAGAKPGWFCGVCQPGRKAGKGNYIAESWDPGKMGKPAAVPAVDERSVSWQEALPGEPAPVEFLDQCAQVIRREAGGADVVAGKGEVNVMSMRMKKGLIRVFLWNNKSTYFQPKIDVGATIKAIRPVTDLPVMPVHWARKSDFRDGADFYKGSFFKVIIPPKGMVILDVAVASMSGR